jgi:hypothetical protein
MGVKQQSWKGGWCICIELVTKVASLGQSYMCPNKVSLSTEASKSQESDLNSKKSTLHSWYKVVCLLELMREYRSDFQRSSLPPTRGSTCTP